MDPEAPKRMSPIQTFNQSNVYPSYKMESHQENLLYHTEVCWLSHGKALKKHHQWVMHIYFTKTSGPNLLPFSVMKSHCQQYAAKQVLKKPQQIQMNQTQPHSNCPSKIKSFYQQKTAFWRKFVVWRQHFENEVFPPLCDFIAKTYPNVSTTKNLSYLVHLKNLESDFSNMFKNLSNSEFQCISDHLLKI